MLPPEVQGYSKLKPFEQQIIAMWTDELSTDEGQAFIRKVLAYRQAGDSIHKTCHRVAGDFNLQHIKIEIEAPECYEAHRIFADSKGKISLSEQARLEANSSASTPWQFATAYRLLDHHPIPFYLAEEE